MPTEPKILFVIEGTRLARGLTRKQMAAAMGPEYSKESLDRIFESEHCPRAETLARMMEVVGMATYPSEWFRSKNGGSDE